MFVPCVLGTYVLNYLSQQGNTRTVSDTLCHHVPQ